MTLIATSTICLTIYINLFVFGQMQQTYIFKFY